jgi:hydrogenase maturation protease
LKEIRVGMDDSLASGGGPPFARPNVEDDDAEPWDISFEGKTVVIGLGNPYMRDDGIGIQAAQNLRTHHLGNLVFIYETQGIDLSLLSHFKGARKIIVLDALRSGQSPGTVTRHVVVPEEKRTSRLPSLHALELYDLLDLASDGELLPCPVIIIGVEPEDCGPGEGLTRTLADALPLLVKATVRELELEDSGTPDTS